MGFKGFLSLIYTTSIFVIAMSLPTSPSSTTPHAALRLWILLTLACWLGLLGLSAQAAGLEVSPIGLVLASDEAAGSFTFSNVEARPIHAQARIFRWTQDEKGEEVLSPTQDILVSPPILAIDPRGSQEIRLIRQQTGGSEELQYRLIVDEIPEPAAPVAKQQIRLVLRYSIPIFLNAIERPVPTLQWHAQSMGKDSTLFTIKNTGKVRAQIAQTWLQSGSEAQAKTVASLSDGLWAYVLPGKTIQRSSPIPYAKLGAAGVTLISTINGQETPVSLEK